ncbi:MAG TPA: hypothetical protein VGH44_04465 [Candidatus Saccharimonadia bacterium]
MRPSDRELVGPGDRARLDVAGDQPPVQVLGDVGARALSGTRCAGIGGFPDGGFDGGLDRYQAAIDTEVKQDFPAWRPMLRQLRGLLSMWGCSFRMP